MKTLLLGLVLAGTISLPLDAQTTDREWQEEAGKRFPEIAVKDSPLNKMFLAEYSRLKQSTPDFFRNNPNWPVIIATQCSAQLSRPAAIPGLEDSRDEIGQLRQQAKAAAEKQDAFATGRSNSIKAAKGQFPSSTDPNSELAQAIVAHIEAITNDPVRRVILNDPKAPEVIAYEAAMQVARRRAAENGTSIGKELAALMDPDARAKAAVPTPTPTPTPSPTPAAPNLTTAVPRGVHLPGGEPNAAAEENERAKRQAAAPAIVNSPEQNRAWSRALGTVTATTSTTRHPTTVSRTAGTYSESESHQTGVYVHFGLVSLKAVQSPYEVQCFFVSGGKGDVAARVYDQHRQLSELPVDAEFLSRSLAGKSETITTSDIELRSTTSNRTYTGTLSKVSQSEGKRSGGWIVRVLVAGKVARVEASLSELKDYAVKNPERLDAVISKVKPTAPAPDKNPATGFGNTSLDRK
jgi:hypothetical protein